jgi:hypothetical protein
LFATLVAAIGSAPESDVAAGAVPVVAEGGEGAPEPAEAERDAVADAATLLPILDQQRAAAPVTVAVAIAASAPASVATPVADEPALKRSQGPGLAAVPAEALPVRNAPAPTEALPVGNAPCLSLPA